MKRRESLAMIFEDDADHLQVPERAGDISERSRYTHDNRYIPLRHIYNMLGGIPRKWGQVCIPKRKFVRHLRNILDPEAPAAYKTKLNFSQLEPVWLGKFGFP